jgi:ferric-dicitrate binding protein FerR (iron transport regulator)
MQDRRLRNEICDLSLKAAEGQLSAVDEARLNELIASNDDACRWLLFASMMDADLVFHARALAAAERAAAKVGPGDSDAPVLGGPPQKGTRIGPWPFGLAAAAVLALSALLIFNRGESLQPSAAVPPRIERLLAERQPEPVASLTLAPGATLDGPAPAASDVFAEGREITLLSGEAHVSMASGADFVLKSPGQLKFVSAKEVQLRRGVLTAHVAEWGSGFTVDTDAMRIIDLGTRFAVAASTDDVETHVLQGQVRVQPLEAKVEGRRSVLLSQGEALRVDRAGQGATRLEAQQDRFPDSPEDFRPFKPIKMFNTGAGLAEGDEDQHWRISAGPVGAGYRGPQFGVVCVPDERYAPNEPERSQWISVAKDLRPGGLPNSVFTFETTVDLVGFDLETVTIAAQVLADNGVRAIRVNGEPAAIEPWDDNLPDQLFHRNRFHIVEIRRGFVPGLNKLEIDVWNGIYNKEGMKADPNPVSVRVEFQAFGRLEGRGEVKDEAADARVDKTIAHDAIGRRKPGGAKT